MKTFVVQYEGVVLPAIALVGARNAKEAGEIVKRFRRTKWTDVSEECPDWLQATGPGFFEIWNGDY